MKVHFLCLIFLNWNNMADSIFNNVKYALIAIWPFKNEASTIEGTWTSYLPPYLSLKRATLSFLLVSFFLFWHDFRQTFSEKLPFFKINFQTSSKILVYDKILGSGKYRRLNDSPWSTQPCNAFENWHKKQKNATLNSHISKARTNLEWRLIFFKITLFSALSTHLGIRHEESAPTNPGSAARGS